MAVLICFLFAIIHILYDCFHITFLSIKVNCAPCLVSLQEKLFIPLPSKSFFLFSLNYFGCICNKYLGVLGV